jgi:hypothetical protein
VKDFTNLDAPYQGNIQPSLPRWQFSSSCN